MFCDAISAYERTSPELHQDFFHVRLPLCGPCLSHFRRHPHPLLPSTRRSPPLACRVPTLQVLQLLKQSLGEQWNEFFTHTFPPPVRQVLQERYKI